MTGENPAPDATVGTAPRFRRFYQGSTLLGKRVEMKDLVAELERQKLTKRDYVVDTDNLKMSLLDGPTLTFPTNEGGTEVGMFVPTERCHAQIANKTGVPLKYYTRMRDEAPDLLCANVNRWMPDKEKRMVRTLDGKARALLSSQFRALDNADLFFAAAKEFAAVGAQVVRADLGEERFYMRAIDPNVSAEIAPGDAIFGGVSVSNSEVGSGSLKVEMYLFRQTCSNGAIGERVFRRLHIGMDLEEGVYEADTIRKTSESVWLKVRDHIHNAFKNLDVAALINGIVAGKKVGLPEPTQLTNGAWGGLDIKPTEKESILKHLFSDGEGQTQFGFGQAITATARDLSDGDRRDALERLGFEMLTAEQDAFEGVMKRAIIPPVRATKVS